MLATNLIVSLDSAYFPKLGTRGQQRWPGHQGQQGSRAAGQPGSRAAKVFRASGQQASIGTRVGPALANGARFANSRLLYETKLSTSLQKHSWRRFRDS